MTTRLHDLCLVVPTVHGNELGLFWAKAFHYSNYSSRAPYKAAVETAIKVFGYDAVATT